MADTRVVDFAFVTTVAGDNTLFLDTVKLLRNGVIQNPGFQGCDFDDTIQGYGGIAGLSNSTVYGWYYRNAGILGPGSAYGNGTPHSGTGNAFFQGPDAGISQRLVLKPGNYQMQCWAKIRPGNDQQAKLLVNNQLVGIVHPNPQIDDWQLYTSPSFIIS
jgi:hypothetical protein